MRRCGKFWTRSTKRIDAVFVAISALLQFDFGEWMREIECPEFGRTF